jgi:hypothetical protein
MPRLCGFQEDHPSGATVYVNPALIRTVRPHRDNTLIEFVDNTSIGVPLPVKDVVEQLNQHLD